jgi:hypothetical protein
MSTRKQPLIAVFREDASSIASRDQIPSTRVTEPEPEA